jgi:hypothetical protein
MEECCHYYLEIESTSCHYYLEIESTIGADLNDVYLEIDTCTRPILLSDLPDIPVEKITGLDDYLDQYEFDCGTP